MSDHSELGLAADDPIEIDVRSPGERWAEAGRARDLNMLDGLRIAQLSDFPYDPRCVAKIGRDVGEGNQWVESGLGGLDWRLR